MSPRNFLNAILNRLVLLGLRGRLSCQLRLRLVDLYQPVFMVPEAPRGSRMRECRDRLEAIERHLPTGPLTALDVGCNIGYFTFELARRGGLCVGIDSGRNEIMIARAVAGIHGISNVAFVEMAIDHPDEIALPQVDVVLCLSLFHHWAAKLGEERARKIMSTVASAAQRFLVFETGQPEETNTKWAASLSFMKPDAESWTRSFLVDLGFPTVTPIGRFASSVSDSPRTLYVASRSL